MIFKSLIANIKSTYNILDKIFKIYLKVISLLSIKKIFKMEIKIFFKNINYFLGMISKINLKIIKMTIYN